MKNKAGIGQKGVTGIGILMIGVIGLITAILMAVTPLIFLKIHLSRVLEIEYGYDNAGMTLLTLLSDRRIYKSLSFYVAGMGDNTNVWFNRAGVEELVKARLDKLVPDRCYRISYSDGSISSQKLLEKKCKTVFGASAHIALPYGKGMEEITLEISEAAGKGTKVPEVPADEKYCCYNPDPLIVEVKCATEEGCVADGWKPEPPEYGLCSEPEINCKLD